MLGRGSKSSGSGFEGSSANQGGRKSRRFIVVLDVEYAKKESHGGGGSLHTSSSWQVYTDVYTYPIHALVMSLPPRSALSEVNAVGADLKLRPIAPMALMGSTLGRAPPRL